jgi:hypothetical protein
MAAASVALAMPLAPQTRMIAITIESGNAPKNVRATANQPAKRCHSLKPSARRG